MTDTDTPAWLQRRIASADVAHRSALATEQGIRRHFYDRLHEIIDQFDAGEIESAHVAAAIGHALTISIDLYRKDQADAR